MIFMGIGLNNSLYAQTEVPKDSLLSSAQQLFDEGSEKKSLNLFLKVLESDSTNFEALWHTSLLYARLGFRLNNEDAMMEHYQTSMKYAEKAIEEYPDEGYSHFVYAIAHGRISDLSKTNTRIKKSHIIKEHAVKATELLPDYAPAWLLLGVWHSEVANISSAQRIAAGVVSKGIPKGASNEKAEEFIKKAIELDPDQTIRYKLDLGRHYLRAGETQKARQTIQELLEVETKNEIDKWNLERAREVLNEIK